ncbi:MAG: UvrD-helicase domain-containing protein [Deferribacterota bacterium]|nr:UvrD-helicase domain-containing protein [Deferribacterota bacterium]
MIKENKINNIFEEITLEDQEQHLNNINVIEASAGTGKTFSIECLFIKFILECNFELKSILVITFTKRATNELKDRLYKRLKISLEYLKNKNRYNANDPLYKYLEKINDKNQSIPKLELAFNNFDEASIHTIHSFCDRTLKEFPFESGVTFNRELFGDDDYYIRQAVYDFWRNQIFSLPPNIYNKIQEISNINSFLRIDIGGLINLAKEVIRYPKAKREILFNHNIIYEREENKLNKLKSEKFDDANEDALIMLRAKFLEYIDKAVDSIKQNSNQITFNDQLKDLYNALEDNNTVLLNKIRNKYNALIVDEFQDTDILQYNILKNIFFNTNKKVFLIGDPKQSIYKFRGADIYIYLEAINEAAYKYCLDTNFRSTKNLINAYNTLYKDSKNPFLVDKIEYNSLNAASEKYKIEGLESNLAIKHFNKEQINQDVAKKQVAKDIINEIGELLNSEKIKIIENGKIRPVEGSDIAIITLENRDGEYLRKELNKYNIVACTNSRESVYESEEAKELKKFLIALSNPANRANLKTALSTSLFNKKASEIYDLQKNEKEWEKVLRDFMYYQNLLQSKGFYRMITEFINDYQIKEKLLKMPLGDRKITNFLHLIELIMKANNIGVRGNYEVIKWLEEKEKQAGSLAEEEHLLRLEREERAINIITIHKSKGLEFPIIFIPFFWKDAQLNKGSGNVIFHNNGKINVDIGSTNYEENKDKCSWENLSEHLRLLYVALTRAACKCYLYYHYNSRNKNICSALNYLLHVSKETSISNIGEIKNILKEKNYNKRLSELEQISKDSGGTIVVESIKTKEPTIFRKNTNKEIPLVKRSFEKEINKQYSVTSYSGLSRLGLLEERMPAIDELTGSFQNDEKENLTGIFAFDKGASSGNLFHKIMENLDFSADKITRGAYIENELKKTKYNTNEHREALIEAIDILLNKNLKNFCNEPLCLKDIPLGDKLTELEFYLNLSNLKDIKRLFIDYFKRNNKDSYIKSIEKLNFEDIEGFINGYMDLVFKYNNKYYIIDWKFNYLGSTYDDYEINKLEEEMLGNYYYLQYHLYILALYRYLKVKEQSVNIENIGGVFYIFARGIQKNRDSGIYYDRPLEFLKQAEIKNVI